MNRFEKLAFLLLVPVLLAAAAWLAWAFLRAPPVDPAAPEPDSASVSSGTRQPEHVPPAEVPPTIDPDRTGDDPMVPDRVPDGPARTSADFASIVGRVLAPNGSPAVTAEAELMRGPALGMSLPGVRSPTGLIVETAHLRPPVAGLAFVALLVVGIAVQAGLMRGERRGERHRSEPDPPAEA